MDQSQKRGPTAYDLAKGFNPERTYNPADDLSLEDRKLADRWKGSGAYADEVNSRLPIMSRLKQLFQTHLLNNNSIEPGMFEDK